MTGESVILHAGAFVAGAIFGSFANVCIHRLPRGVSVVSPPSRCPSCATRIAFYDNVPVVSWIVLGGRCRRCGATISARYPLVELSVAVLFLLSSLAWGPTPLGAAAALLSTCCVILVSTDVESRVLPDEVTIGGLVVALGLAALRDGLEKPQPFRLFQSHILEALAGAAFGAALLLVVRAAYRAVRGIEGMGLGDVKMIAMLGGFLGPAGVLLTLFFASLAGSLGGGVLVLARRLTWSRAFRRARRGMEEARTIADAGGVLADADGHVLAAGRRWLEIPSAPPVGASARSAGPPARTAAAFVRLSMRRAARGMPTDYGRLVLDDGGDFFRVLAARARGVPGGVLVLLSRADIPFGVLLAGGALLTFAFGRGAVERLLGEIPVPMRLLP